MTTSTPTPASAAQDSWRRFLETYEPLRSQLYRYCRYLTRSPWDAEDLAQDALARLLPSGELAVMPGSMHGTYLGAAEGARPGSPLVELGITTIQAFLAGRL